MAAFHLFPRLPFELRARIWELTVEPRTVEVRVKKDNSLWGEGEILHVTSSTPVPAVLQACHEARNLRLYQQAFNFSSAVEPRYVWVNFDIDMISIGDTGFDINEPAEQLLIRRLTFERENLDCTFYPRSLELEKFSNLEEIHVIYNEGMMAFQDAYEYIPWPCPKQNLKIFGKKVGLIAVGEDMDEMAETHLAAFPDYQRQIEPRSGAELP
ncbi:hypothetical protein Asppvi_011089 [Aspergillus pseudoviridinutans]|uniref:2EXR domain-containing protein n=1 Tax=Aspergillus pseudoviridinutans TaxID=1517512 RepID=A0A9P3BQL0_9EURO|nr:uncharacterized protein Asppvi_011089 [Aspergillus pseudoviridinutans]GIJ92114.1 hypothetical protein Asppvi_011089 [Aspergillus pseudoviridinutans]